MVVACYADIHPNGLTKTTKYLRKVRVKADKLGTHRIRSGNAEDSPHRDV
jgi:hypothetical protein